MIKTQFNALNINEKIILLPSSKNIIEENELYKNDINNAILNSNVHEINLVSNKDENLDDLKAKNLSTNNDKNAIQSKKLMNENKKKNGCCNIF
jgi:hypothetical protein